MYFSLANLLQLRRPYQDVALRQFDTFWQSRRTRRAQHECDIVCEVDRLAFERGAVADAHATHQIVIYRHIDVLSRTAASTIGAINYDDRFDEFILLRYGYGRFRHRIRCEYYPRTRQIDRMMKFTCERRHQTSLQNSHELRIAIPNAYVLSR